MPAVQEESNRGTDAGAEGILAALIARYGADSQPLEVNFRNLAPVHGLKAEATHLLHPYPAKLVQNIPRLFLGCSQLRATGRTLFDPFCGSGTVLLEGQFAGLRVAGADSNPLARLITTAKLTPLDVAAAGEDLERIVASAAEAPPTVPDVVNLTYWFSGRVIDQLGKLRHSVERIVPVNRRAFFDVCFSAAVRRVSFADPRLSVPVKINPDRADVYGAKGAEVLRKLKRLESIDVFKVFWAIVAQNLRRVSATQHAYPNRSFDQSLCVDATALGLSSKTVDLIITSPPYVGAQKYIRASSLSLGWLGLTPDSKLRPYERKSIGREHLDQGEGLIDNLGLPAADDLIASIAETNLLRARIAQRYLLEMDIALAEMGRVLKAGGYLILVAGPNLVAGHAFDTPSFLKSTAEANGFQTVLHLVDTIASRGLMTKRNRTAGLIQQEAVFVMRRA